MPIDKEKYNNFSVRLLNKKFITACETGNLELVQFLTSPELKKKINVHINGDIAFKLACKNNHIDIVSFLLTSPLIKKKPNINIENDSPVRQACINESIDVMNYLLTSKELKKKADIYALNNWAIKTCLKNKQKKSLEYLIITYDMQINEDLKKTLLNDLETLRLIEKRDLNKQLNNELNNLTKASSGKRQKI